MTGRPQIRIALGALSMLIVGNTVAGDEEIPIIDAHSQVDQHVDLDRIVPLLDKAGVQRIILATRGKRKLKELAALTDRHPDRITMSLRTKGGAFERNKPRYYALLKKQLAMPQIGAIAEVILWHAQKGNKAGQREVRAGAPQVQAALQIALDWKWPFIAHYEFAAPGPHSRDIYMADFENLLGTHPAHPFLLIHMGQLGPAEARRLLRVHGNVHFLTSHANTLTVSKSKQPWVDMFDGERLSAEWRALVIAYPDRFVLAFDNVFADHWGAYFLEQVALWRKALADLPVDVAHKLAHGNAERLWRLK